MKTTEIETTEEKENGEVLIKTETVENKKQIVETCNDDGDIRKKVIESEKKIEAIENQLEGETLDLKENYVEKI